MNRLLELWSEFRPKISVIYQTYVDTLWTKVGVPALVILILINLGLIPFWLQCIFLIILTTIMVWSLFGLGKKPSNEPAKRQISITTSSGDEPTVNNFLDSKSSTRGVNGTVSGSAVSRTDYSDVDDAELDTNSTSSVAERLQKQSISSREPLDQITWSAVTSPGFTTRILQHKNHANGNPLRESNSPNLKSPMGSGLGLGQRPAPWKAESKLNPPSFQSPVNTGRYSVTRKKKQVPFGTTFVHVAPVDVINQALVKNSPGQGLNGLGSTGLDRSGGWNGMGGYHPASPGPPPPNVRIQQKLWQPPVMGEVAVPYEGIGRPNVLGGQHPMNQQLMSSGDHGGNRKRVRIPDGLMDGRPGPTRSPVPNYVHHDELTKQNSKRTKYIQSTDMRYPNVMVSSTHRHSPYVNALPTCDDETMTSESILEQMNKTEKRFLPDDDTIARMRSPKKARSNSSPKGPGNMQPGSPISYRKRRQVMTTLEDEDESEKNRGFCSCSECYEEAAGMNESRSRSAERSLQLNSSISSSKKKKFVSFCNSTMDEKGYISAIAKKGKANDATEKFSPVPLQVITKERHEADKKRRLERLNRMLNESFKRSEYKPETSPIQSPPSNVNNTTISGLTSGGIKPTVLFGSSKSSEDVVDNASKAPTTTSSSVAATTSAPFSFGVSSTTTAVEAKEAEKTAETKSSGFSFGLSSTSATSDSAKPPENVTSTEPSKTSASGFSFGAPASTTAASSVPTATSPATFGFGAGSAAPSSEPSAASAGSFSFGAPTTTSQVASPAATAATSSSIFGSGGAGTSLTPAGQTTSAALPASTFSFGSNVAAPTPATNSAPDVPKTAGGFSFGQGTTTFGAASDAPKAAAAATTASSGFSFGAPPAASPVASPAPSTQNMTFLSSATTTTASTLFGQSTTAVPSMFGKDSASPVQSGSIFGATATAAPAVASTLSSSTSTGAPIPASTAAPAFSFGAAGAAAATSAPAPATTSGGLFAFGQKKDSAPSPFGGQKTDAATTFGQPTTQASSSGSIFGQQQAGSTGGLFGQAAPTTTAPASSSSLFSFGKPNVDAVKTAFGAPSASPAPAPAATFGATATTTAGGFGQTSGGFSFGSTATTPKFGQATTTAVAAGAPPAFGQAAPTSSTPSFGQPSSKSATPTFGQTAAATPSFGQTPSTAPPPYGQGTTSTFGQAGSSSTPAFGQSTSTTFGQSTTGSTPAFGQSSTGTTPAFGQSNAQSPTPAFGQSSAAPVPSSSTFGGSVSSPFGQQQQPQATSPFGGSATSGGNVFGSAPAGSSTFGQSSKTTSAFGAATTTPSFGASGSTSFGGAVAGGASSPFGQQSPAASPFGGGGATSPTAFGQTTTQSNTSFGGGNASAFGQAAASPSSGFSFGGGAPAGANTSFGAPATKPFGQQSSNTSGAFSFGSNQPSNASFSFGGGSNNNAPAPAFGGSGGGGFGGAAQPASNVSFGGATAAANPAQAAPAPGVFQFGQQQPSQGGFNFAAQAQASPQFGGAPQQQQQQPMFNIGSSSSTARRRDPRTRRYR